MSIEYITMLIFSIIFGFIGGVYAMITVATVLIMSLVIYIDVNVYKYPAEKLYAVLNPLLADVISVLAVACVLLILPCYALYKLNRVFSRIYSVKPLNTVLGTIIGCIVGYFVGILFSGKVLIIIIIMSVMLIMFRVSTRTANTMAKHMRGGRWR